MGRKGAKKKKKIEKPNQLGLLQKPKWREKRSTLLIFLLLLLPFGRTRNDPFDIKK